MGNSLACIWAREMGHPIAKIILSCNENDSIPEFFKTGEFLSKDSVQTLANAMDVGTPSNMERFLHLNSRKNLSMISAYKVTDEQIKQSIVEVWTNYSEIVCPHTATAFYVRSMFPEEEFIVVATAHPSKFSSVVQPLIDEKIQLAPQLQHFLSREVRSIDIEPTKDEVLKAIKKYLIIK